jgi:hypothetical protein
MVSDNNDDLEKWNERLIDWWNFWRKGPVNNTHGMEQKRQEVEKQFVNRYL